MDQATDLMTALQKLAHHSPAKKTCGACDQNYQIILLWEFVCPS